MSSVPHRSFLPCAAVLLIAFGALPCALHANEHAPAVAASAPLAMASAPNAAGSAPARAARKAADASAEPRGPQDPMEMLRERLAKKLGVVKSPDPGNPNLVRVETKSSEPAPKENPHEAAPRRAVYRAPATTTARHAVAEPTHSPHWDYTGSGSPAAWAQLNPEFAKCGNGARQSPIDIRDGIKVELDPVQFSYQPSAFRVIDNGHTVQVNVAAGNFIEVMGRRFELRQFHFHRPSEERVGGKQFDMVVHLVHQDAQGRLAVVAVLLESGSAQAIVQSVWNNLPLEKGEEVAARGDLDLGTLLPHDRGYFTYMGSLTTPPCSEGVLWMVMKQPVPISPEQIGVFARLYPMNARPVQPLGDRLIKESN